MKKHNYNQCYPFSVAEILQAGLMTRWKQVYWLPDDACSVKGGIGSGFSTTVTVSDMQGSFYILGLGMLKSLLIVNLNERRRRE